MKLTFQKGTQSPVIYIAQRFTFGHCMSDDEIFFGSEKLFHFCHLLQENHPIWRTFYLWIQNCHITSKSDSRPATAHWLWLIHDDRYRRYHKILAEKWCGGCYNVRSLTILTTNNLRACALNTTPLLILKSVFPETHVSLVASKLSN